MADEKRLLEAACAWVNDHWDELHHGAKEYQATIGPDQIVGSRQEGDTLIVVVNRGTLGSPKYYAPLAELEKTRVTGRRGKSMPVETAPEEKEDE